MGSDIDLIHREEPYIVAIGTKVERRHPIPTKILQWLTCTIVVQVLSRSNLAEHGLEIRQSCRRKKGRMRRLDIVQVQAPMQPLIGALFERVYSPLLASVYGLCLDWVLTLTQDRPSTVIDIGCGPGTFGRMLLEKSSQLKWIGIEPSDYFYPRLKSGLAQRFPRRAQVSNANAETFDFGAFPDALIVSHGSIKHWTDTGRALGALAAAKPKGYWISEVCSEATDGDCNGFLEPLPLLLRVPIKWQFRHRIVPRGITRMYVHNILQEARLPISTLERFGPFVIATHP